MSLSPAIWGLHFWKTLHYVSWGYPLYPDTKDKESFKNIIDSLEYMLPCGECRRHVKDNLKSMPLTDEILSIKLKLILWVFNLHNMVSSMTGKKTMQFEYAIVSLISDKYKPLTNMFEYDHDHENNDQNQNHVHNHDHDAIASYDDFLDTYKRLKKNKSDSLKIKLNDLFAIHDEEYAKSKDLEKEFSKATLNINKFFSDEKIAEIKKKEEENKKKHLDFYSNAVKNSGVEQYLEQHKHYQDTIDVDLLLNNFVNAINSEHNAHIRTEMINALNLILESL
jgi:hypothetical protein